MIRPKIKICGIKCPDIAYKTSRLGVDYIGMIFHPKSKRHIELETAKLIIQAVKSYVTPVPVFVDQSVNEILDISQMLNVNTVQLHGNTARKKHEQLPQDISRIYALSVNEKGNLVEKLEDALEYLNPKRDFLLFDGPIAGSGKRISTERLSDLAGKFNFFLAGGLNANNVKSAIALCNPYGIDVSSGVEDSSGNKDFDLIENFVMQLGSRSEIQ